MTCCDINMMVNNRKPANKHNSDIVFQTYNVMKRRPTANVAECLAARLRALCRHHAAVHRIAT